MLFLALLRRRLFFNWHGNRQFELFGPTLNTWNVFLDIHLFYFLFIYLSFTLFCNNLLIVSILLIIGINLHLRFRDFLLFLNLLNFLFGNSQGFLIGWNILNDMFLFQCIFGWGNPRWINLFFKFFNLSNFIQILFILRLLLLWFYFGLVVD